jgi:glycerophosphoryl diester phosphodiesterase
MNLKPLREYPFKERPMVTAHRGDISSGARENTLEAIALAIDSGAEMIEVDVQQSSDQEFFCYHDERLAGEEEAIFQMDSAALVSKGVTPLLSILELVRGKCYMNLEVKEYSPRDPKAFMRNLEGMVERMKMQDWVLYSSFRADYIMEAGWISPTIIIQPSNEMAAYFASRTPRPTAIPQTPESMLPSELMRQCKATSYACEVNELTPARLTDLRKHNTMVSVYTVTTREEFERVIAFGVGGFVTDCPREAVKWRDEYVASQSR